MNVIYTERAKQESEGYHLLQQLTKNLEEVIGPPAANLTAQWDRTNDAKGQTRYTLGITDSADKASTSFEPDELKSNHHMRYRLLRLYDNLLKARTDRHFRRLEDMGSGDN